MKLNHLAYFGFQIVRMHLQPGYRAPLSMHLLLTNRCNLNCEYCSVHDLPQKDVWTTESLKKVLSEMKACGTRRIHFTGGEPMMRRDLGELITYAKKLGLFVSFVSNGTQIAKRIHELKDADVVFLSYDGLPEIHGRIRGQRSVEDFDSALAALKGAGIKVWTTTVITRLNANRLEEILNFARRNNITANFTRLEYFTQPPYHLHPKMEEVKDLIVKDDEMKEVYKKLIKLKQSGAPIGSTLEYLKNGLNWPHENKTYDSKPSKHYTCWAGRAYGHLEADGMLYSCGTGVGRVEGVSVLKEGFRSAWEKLILLENCRSCSHACGVESNLIFSLNFSSILNHITHLRR